MKYEIKGMTKRQRIMLYDIDTGQIFRWGDLLYIKVGKEGPMDYLNAMSLTSGWLVTIPLDAQVERYTKTIEFEESGFQAYL